MPWQDVVAGWRADECSVDICELPGRLARWADLPAGLGPRLATRNA